MTPATAETLDEIKARGAFYTPEGLARFLVRWGVRSRDERVVEPSCGDGAFVTALVDRFRELGGEASAWHLLGVEREPSEAAKTRSLAPDGDIREIDFFDLDPTEVAPVDVAIGNPPYIRYHRFAGSDREKALGRARLQGVELNQLASSWAHFTVHAAGFLKPTGRLALVLPAELLHADYGLPVRDFLLRRFASLVVIAFDRMVFPEALVDAVLLLAASDGPPGLQVVRVRDADALGPLELEAIARGKGQEARRWSSAVDVDAAETYRRALQDYEVQRVGDMASVDIGLVTGADDFFVLSTHEAEARELPSSVLSPAVRRPRDVPGLTVASDELSWLLDLAGGKELPDSVGRYLAEGERRGISERYKCRVRKPWYVVPLPRQRPDAFIPYMSHLGPRLIVNDLGARSTNLLHGVSLNSGAPTARALAVAMCSSLTLLSAEIEGRAYGGGVLKLETREAERLVVPVGDTPTSKTVEGIFDRVDGLIRYGDVQAAAKASDAAFGLDHDTLWRAYSTFRDRRLGRRCAHPAAASNGG
ncbi:MAG: N-6 DNA methylase [Chloroflexota bacterium]